MLYMNKLRERKRKEKEMKINAVRERKKNKAKGSINNPDECKWIMTFSMIDVHRIEYQHTHHDVWSETNKK